MDKDRIDRASQLEVPLFPLLKENIHTNYLCESGASLTSVKKTLNCTFQVGFLVELHRLIILEKLCFSLLKEMTNYGKFV